MPVLTGQNAIIRTATVEIKTMHIGNKQVTLAVFRQLKEEDIIDGETGQLKGVPWGTVNYFWGDCKEDSHLHVVWQKGTALRRCCLQSGFYWTPDGRALRDELASVTFRLHAVARLAVALQVIVHPDVCLAQLSVWTGAHRIPVSLVYAGATHTISVSLAPQDLRQGDSGEAVRQAYWLLREWGNLRPDNRTRQQEIIWQSIVKSCNDETSLPIPSTPGAFEVVMSDYLTECFGDVAEYRQREAMLTQAWSAHYTAIAALDQLFIAV